MKTNNEKFDKAFERIKKNFFDFKSVEEELNDIEESNHERFVRYVLIQFKKLTIQEWMKEFAHQNFLENRSDNKFLNGTQDHFEYMQRITNLDYSTTAIGIQLKGNLIVFQQKCETQIEELKFNNDTHSAVERTHNKLSVELDQDLQIQKFEKECFKYNLKKGKTIPREALYDIASSIGMKVPNDIDKFITGEGAYQIAREYASRLGFKRKYRRS